MKKEMLINASQAEECRIAVLEDGRLEELYVERASQDNFAGNIYLGKIVNMEPSIQAAFVNFGVGRNGFLHISDVEPAYYVQGGYDPDAEEFSTRTSNDRKSRGGRSTKRRDHRSPQAAEFDDALEADPRDIDPRDLDPRDLDPRDLDPQDRDPRDSDPRGPGADDIDPRDIDPRDSGSEDSESRRHRGRKQGRRPTESRTDRRRGRQPGKQRGQRAYTDRPRFKPPIQEIFQRGDSVLVQVIKEGIGTKGPTLSTYISIPGRYLVLMPALGRIGVSRKIEDEAERRRLKGILREMNPPKGLGFIVRTAGQGRSRKDLSRDMAYLLRLWKAIVRRVNNEESPTSIYEESDMIIRTIRDIVTSDVDAIIVDRQEAYERCKEFLKLVMPRHSNRLSFYEGKDPLFHKYNLEEAIAQIHRREVALPEGGSIVIDQTEALVAIDVNSGNFRVDDSAEETAYRLNLAAANEITRQLRLRDLGGVIVNDFIDMRREKHRRGVERAMRDALKRDRARTKILRTSPFGLIEMTRQRIRPSLKRSVYTDCPCCSSRGVVKTDESMALDVMRLLMLAAQQPKIREVLVSVHEQVASFLNNQKRKELAQFEEEGGLRIKIRGRENVYPEHLELDCRDERGNQIELAK